MKSLLFVSHKMNLGGTEKALLSLLSALEKESLAVTLLLLEHGGLLEFRIPDFVSVQYFEGFDRIKPVINDPPLQTFKNYLKSLKIITAFKYLFTYGKIKRSANWYHNYKAVLHNVPHFGTYDIAVAFAGPSDFISYFIAKKITAKKKIQWIHFDIENVIANYNFGRKFYPCFNQIFCVSKSSKDIFLKHFPGLETKTDVFHNIISAEEIKKEAHCGISFKDNYKGIRILTVARFTQEKGQHLIPEVVAKLRADGFDFRWYLIGDGKEKIAVEKKCSALGISNQVIFLGEKENPYPYMRDCAIYVQPSLHEGFGITVEEVKVFNKPIVVTGFASATDLIENQKTGIITEISTKGIYKGLKALLLDDNLRRKLSENLVNKEPLLQFELNKLLKC